MEFEDYPIDREEYNDNLKKTFNNGWDNMNIPDFIERLKDEIPMSGVYGGVKSFCRLIKSHGLVIRDKTGNPISSTDELMNRLLSRSEKGEAIHDAEIRATPFGMGVNLPDEFYKKYEFEFWETLEQESHYLVLREDVAKAYHHAKRLKFPWRSLNSEINSMIDVADIIGNGLNGKTDIEQTSTAKNQDNNKTDGETGLITLQKLLKLLDCNSIPDLESLCYGNMAEVDKNGIYPVYPDYDMQRKLHTLELEALFDCAENLELKLPCTKKQLLEWAERNGFSDLLPDDFIYSDNNADNNKDSIKADGETELKPVIKNNDFDYSGLLKEPAKKDDWFFVIDDMAKQFYAEYKKLPNEIQAWGRLWTNPPDGYTVTTGKDKGDDCLNMPSVNPLSRSAFTKRWKNYTNND